MNKWLELSASLAAERKPKKQSKNLPLPNLNKDKAKTDLQTKGFISMVSNTTIRKEDSSSAKNKEKGRLPFKP